MKKKDSIRKICICILNALFMMLIFFAGVNLGIIKVSCDKRLTPIDDKNAVIIENADGSEDIFFNAEGGIYIKKLLFDISPKEQRPSKIKITVSFLTDGSDIKELELEDINPIYVGTEVINIDRENVTSVHITEAADGDAKADALNAVSGEKASDAESRGKISFGMSGFCIDNRLNFSPYVLIFAGLLGMAAAAFILFRDTLSQRPEYAFLIICLTMGLSMCLSLPREKVSYDEETHMQSVFAIASLPSGELHLNDDALNQLLITEYNNPDAMPGSSEEMAELTDKLSLVCDYKSGSHTPTFHVMPSRAPAYLAMAAGVKAAKLFNLGWADIILVMRLSNLLMYTALMFLAIRLIPVGKWLMLIIALFPENVFMASACSYDPFILGALSLGYAFMLKGKRYAVPMLICFILGCMPKAVYAPVVLMGLIISFNIFGKASDTDTNTRVNAGRKGHVLLISAGVVIFVIFIAVFIIPTVISPEDTGDIRGGEVSALRQVRFILFHPITYTVILLSQMAEWLRQCWFGADCTTFMGHIVNGQSKFKGFYHAYLTLLAAGIFLSHAETFSKYIKGQKLCLASSASAVKCGISNNSSALRLSKLQRFFMLFMSFAAAVLIWTAMYVAFTEPGAEKIAGVQGRYFIPLFFPVYLAFSGVNNHVCTYAGTVYHKSTEGSALLETGALLCYYLLEFAELILLALTIWVTIIKRFCI